MKIKKLNKANNFLKISIIITICFSFVSHSFFLKITFLLLALFCVLILNKNEITIERIKNDKKIKQMLLNKREIRRECLEFIETIESILRKNNQETDKVVYKFERKLNDSKRYRDYLSLSLELKDYLIEMMEKIDTNSVKKSNVIGVSYDIKDLGTIEKIYLYKNQTKS